MSSTSGTGGSLLDFRQQATRLVNAKRQLHGASALVHSGELEHSAQIWAEALAAKGFLENSAEAKLGRFGESVSMRSVKEAGRVEISADEVVSQWYSENAKYDFKSDSAKGSNFTQMVWLGSQRVGFGKAHADGRVVVVAHYSPAGNVRNRYRENVNPPLDSDEDLDVAQLVGELAGFRVVMREVLRDEEVDGGRPVLVERERIELEDGQGNTKEKVVERRIPKAKPGEKSEPQPPQQQQQQQPRQQEVETRPGSIVQVKDKELTKFASKVLSQHNRHRSSHGAKTLKLNSDLSALAQSFAEELSSKSKLYNSGTTYRGDRLGENIACRWSNGPTDYDGEEVVDHWYSESEKFRYNEEPTDIQGVGNFTQLVWRNSRELGVGKAVYRGTDGSHKVVVVCYYHPSGNVIPCFRENVHPPSK